MSPDDTTPESTTPFGLTDRAHERERGYVMVLLALSMVVLLGFAGYSVDVGNWNLQRNELRSVAEASALGGVAFLPDDFPTARATAIQLAVAQGIDPGEVSVSLGSAPNRLRVTITRDVDNYFIRVLGMNTTTIAEHAVAEFEQPVDMGSPYGILGNDPDTGWNPQFWLSHAGRQVDKALGDRFATRRCTPGTSGCTGTWNAEWDTTGYQYAVRVADDTQPFRIQAFDPAWVWTGSSCNIPDFPTAAEIASLNALSGTDPHIPVGYYDDAATRYAAGSGLYCTGDDFPGTNGTATTFTIRLPDATPWDDLDNPIVSTGRCQPTTFPAYTPTSPYLDPTQTIYEWLEPSGDNEWRVHDDGIFTFAEVFRRWVTICDLSPGPWLTIGDYIVQVTADNTGGQNRYSLRAGVPSGTGVTAVGQSISSRRRMPIFANTDDADTSFFLTRVPPSFDERLLRVSFFDIGDAAAPGTLTIVPPPGSGLTAFPNCTFTLGGAPLASANCRLNNVWSGNGFDGQVVAADVLVPSITDPTTPYNCDETDPDDCWVTVRAQFVGGITDATTWTAELIGDAVRIVPE